MALLFGRYETLREIASGGMATVHLGRAKGAGGFERLVAIKVMHPHIAKDPDFIAMFLDEARLAARIRHPNVVATIDVQEAPEGLFLVMDYVEGPSLAQLLRLHRKQREQAPLDVVLRIQLDALGGLHAAHELCDSHGEPLKLVHRDISPHNILVGVDGVSRITDFGVARAEARIGSTRDGQVKGKLSYMAPEQARGAAIDRRCDIYAAGVVLWEALVGERLFDCDHQGEAIARILEGTPSSPRDKDGRIGKAINAVCMKALATKPGKRYGSAEEFTAALEHAAAKDGVQIASTRRVAEFVAASQEEAKELSNARDDQTLSSTNAGEDDVTTSNSQVSPTGAVLPAATDKGLHSRAGVLLTGGLLVAVGAVAAIALLVPNSDADPNALPTPMTTTLSEAPSPATTGVATEPVPPTRTASTAEPPTAPPQASATASATHSAEPTASSSATIEQNPPKTSRPKVSGAPRPPRRLPTPTPAAEPPPSPTSFRPTDL